MSPALLTNAATLATSDELAMNSRRISENPVKAKSTPARNAHIVGFYAPRQRVSRGRSWAFGAGQSEGPRRRGKARPGEVYPLKLSYVQVRGRAAIRT
jgi:hypothetical protein